MQSLDDLYLHPVSRTLAESCQTDLPHAVLLHGQKGSGLTTLALTIARSISPDPGGILTVEPDGDKDLTIDQIRQLYTQTHSIRETPLVVIIDRADRMSQPAQNAFLKLLEEPPHLVHFMLTAHAPHQLLVTIHSRVNVIEVQPIDTAQTQELLDELHIHDTSKRAQLEFIAHGRPAELSRLARDQEYFETAAELVRTARTVLRGSSYERLVALSSVMNDRKRALQVTRSIGDLLLRSSALLTPRALSSRLAATTRTIEALEQNSNTRLAMLWLALHLS